MLALVELARASRPLEDTLCAMCRLVAGIAGVEVVSVYLQERDGVLVMRGNVGFPAAAIGRVQLGVCEGLTGVVAERRRAVTVAAAQQDERYKHVAGIGEEQFAAYLGVPLLARDAVAGVLVLQRRAPGSFSEADVVLASSLTAPCLLAIERERARGGVANRFAGTAVVPGRASGGAVVLPPGSARPVSEAAALHALELDQGAAAHRLGHGGPGVARVLANFGLVAAALRGHLAGRSPGDGVIAALEHVPYRGAAGAKDLGALVDERHREVRELWAFLVADVQHRLAICGGVLVVPRLGAFLALEAVARGAIAAVSGEPIEAGACEVLAAAQLPAIAGVPELVARVRGGERLDVDAAEGHVVVGG